MQDLHDSWRSMGNSGLMPPGGLQTMAMVSEPLCSKEDAGKELLINSQRSTRKIVARLQLLSA